MYGVVKVELWERKTYMFMLQLINENEEILKLV